MLFQVQCQPVIASELLVTILHDNKTKNKIEETFYSLF